MSRIARDLEETLQRIDARAAARVTRLVREILLFAETQDGSGDSETPAQSREGQLPDLAAHAEPMGALSNVEIDQAIYGR